MEANAQATEQAPQENSKEINFRAQEKAMKEHYERQLVQERTERERIAAEKDRIARELELAKRSRDDDDDVDSEPYVDHRKLNKKLNQYEQKQQQQTQTEIQRAMQMAREEAKKEAWLENNQDFYETLQQHAEKLAQKSPALAKSILAMPDNFELKKLVYQSIKEFGLDKPEEKKSSVQDKIEANKRGQFYQPSNIGSAPYQGQTADFSESGQKAAYAKMQALIKNVRIS